MSYRLIYTVPFASLENIPCVVEIEKENYFGEITELQGGSSPFTVDIADEDFLYIPTRFSTAKISIVGSDYLQSLFSTAYQQYRVTFKKNGVVTWCGFIKPELYTQDYSSKTFELELECMSAMSSLEFIDYEQAKDTREFISFWDILKKCISAASGQYTAVYIPHVYAKNKADYDMQLNILEHLTVSEQDFFDEDDKPMKLKEVLEEVCKFLNWTCVDWRGELYFVDVDHLGNFYKYNPDLISKIEDTSPNFINIQRKDYTGRENTLDVLPGYNKATVNCSNYCYNDIISEEEFKQLDAFTERKTYNYKQYYEIRQYLKSKVFKLPRYENLNDKLPYCNLVDENAINVYVDEPTRSFLGGYCAKRCEYEVNDGKPNITDYNWEYLYQFKLMSDYTYPSMVDQQQISVSKQLPTGAPLLKFQDNKPIKYHDGAFGISMSYSQPLNSSNMTSYEKYKSGGVYGAEIACRLIIGDYYYTNNGWVKSATKQPTGLDLTFDLSFDLKHPNEWAKNQNTKTLEMPYEGLSGYVIEIPDNINLFGRLEFEILKKIWLPEGVIGGFFFKDIKIDFKKKDGMQEEESNSDRIYENIVNENYINELDEIEFKISSYNKDGACYSKVMIGENYLTDNLYSNIEATTIRPEEQLIRRIIKRYNATRIKLTQVIKASSDITPLSRLYDNYMVNKKFINAGGTIDYKMNQFQCIMIEV
nr:MAG TPA: hypothetical protein [Caudoviricetes sp.]